MAFEAYVVVTVSEQTIIVPTFTVSVAIYAENDARKCSPVQVKEVERNQKSVKAIEVVVTLSWKRARVSCWALKPAFSMKKGAPKGILYIEIFGRIDSPSLWKNVTTMETEGNTVADTIIVLYHLIHVSKPTLRPASSLSILLRTNTAQPLIVDQTASLKSHKGSMTTSPPKYSRYKIK